MTDALSVLVIADPMVCGGEERARGKAPAHSARRPQDAMAQVSEPADRAANQSATPGSAHSGAGRGERWGARCDVATAAHHRPAVGATRGDRPPTRAWVGITGATSSAQPRRQRRVVRDSRERPADPKRSGARRESTPPEKGRSPESRSMAVARTSASGVRVSSDVLRSDRPACRLLGSEARGLGLQPAAAVRNRMRCGHSSARRPAPRGASAHTLRVTSEQQGQVTGGPGGHPRQMAAGTFRPHNTLTDRSQVNHGHKADRAGAAQCAPPLPSTGGVA